MLQKGLMNKLIDYTICRLQSVLSADLETASTRGLHTKHRTRTTAVYNPPRYPLIRGDNQYGKSGKSASGECDVL